MDVEFEKSQNNEEPWIPEGFNPLSLDNQLCFALYVCSKEIIRRYNPILEPLGLTYTSYITLLGLWEKDDITVKELGQKLFLDSGTLTPLLKKMEIQGLVKRTRSNKDERTVYVRLTEEGRAMRSKCQDIPRQMMCYNFLDLNKAGDLLQSLHSIMEKMQ
ncbi:MAG: MarR family transcriptional regulator [Treponema sp.]|nr:MarR family transcriptional regulator [Treponema sp.]